MSCPCKHKRKVEPMDEKPETPTTPAPTRSGACPFCLRKHLLAARGYAREVAEDPTREWETEMLIENLVLAEDHALALGEQNLRDAIRTARHTLEDGATPDVCALYEAFKASDAWRDALAKRSAF